MQHYLSSILCFNINCIGCSIKSFFIYFSNICQLNTKIIKYLIFKSFDTHMIKSISFVLRCKYYKTVFCDANYAFNNSQSINE